MQSGEITSSASRKKTYSPLASRMPRFRAAEGPWLYSWRKTTKSTFIPQEAIKSSAKARLLSQPQSEENFNAAMDQIMGSCMPEEELDELYTKFKESAALDSSYPQMKEKVESL